MKKNSVNLIIVFLLVICSFSFFVDDVAAAQDNDRKKVNGVTTMTFESEGDKVTVKPSSIFTDTDLFSSFKNVMPGDVKTEEIYIQNRCTKRKDILIYIKSKTENDGEKGSIDIDEMTGETVESMKDFLSKLNVKVWVNEKLFYEGTANFEFKKDQKLVMIPWNGDATVRVELTVPLSLDNVYADRLGQVNWYFKTVDYNENGNVILGIVPPNILDDKIDMLIQTGQLKWPIGILIGIGIIFIGLGLKKRKNRKQF